MPAQIVMKKVITLSPRTPITVTSRAQQKFSNAQVRRSLFSILQENVLCSMATVTKQNRAHINHAYFSYSENLDFYFLSDPASLHCRNLLTNSSMAMTIFNSSQKWGGSDRGLQLFGTCREVARHRALAAEQSYAERFQVYEKWRASRGERDRFQYRFYRFVPSRIKMLDEEVFGGGVFVVAAVMRRKQNEKT